MTNKNLTRFNDERLVALKKYSIEDGFLSFTTTSYGCTFFDSFKLIADKEKPNRISVIQVRPDNCRMSPREISLQFSIRHLVVDTSSSVYLNNPIETDYAITASEASPVQLRDSLATER